MLWWGNTKFSASKDPCLHPKMFALATKDIHMVFYTEDLILKLRSFPWSFSLIKRHQHNCHECTLFPPLMPLKCQDNSIREKCICSCHMSSICLPLVLGALFSIIKVHMIDKSHMSRPLKSCLFPSPSYVVIQNIQLYNDKYLLRLNI